MSRSELDQAVTLLETARTVALFVQGPDDTDAIASSLALTHLLNARQTQTNIYTGGQPRASIGFLDPTHVVQPHLTTSREVVVTVPANRDQMSGLRYERTDKALVIHIGLSGDALKPSDVRAKIEGTLAADLIITLNVPNLRALGSRFTDHTNSFYSTPILNLGYAVAGQRFGTVNLIDWSVRSSAELVYRLITHWGASHVTAPVATALLAGLMASTDSFQQPMTSPAQFDLGALLLDRGADRMAIVRNLFKNKPLNDLHVWGRLLSRLTTHVGGSLVCTTTTETELRELGATTASIHELLRNLLVHAIGAKAVVVVEQRATTTVAHVATPHHGNALDLARAIGTAQGTDQLATAQIQQKTAEVRAALGIVIEAGTRWLATRYTGAKGLPPNARFSRTPTAAKQSSSHPERKTSSGQAPRGQTRSSHAQPGQSRRR